MWSDDSQLLAQTQRREQLLQEQRLVEDEYNLAREREERMRQLEVCLLSYIISRIEDQLISMNWNHIGLEAEAILSLRFY